MKKRAFIIHGWEGYPEEPLFLWLKKNLESKEFEVYVPSMPDTENPKIALWVKRIKDVVKEARTDDIFIGHSIGCQAILRYLETLDNDKKVNKIIFIAPWLRLVNLESEESWKIAKPWFRTPIDFKKVKTKSNSFLSIFSDNDPWVPLDSQDEFKKKLDSKIILEHSKGHFSEEDKIFELPIVLEDVFRNN